MFKSQPKQFRPRVSREQRLANQGQAAQKKKEAEALELISRFRDIFELLSDAIFLGQVSSQQKAYEYISHVRQQRYLPENPTWQERNRLFQLAAIQHI